MNTKTNSTLKFLIIAPLFLVIVIDILGVGLIFPVQGPLFLDATGGLLSGDVSLGMREFLYGLALALFAIGQFVGAPILGDISDHIGRKKTLLICLSFTAISFFMCAYAITEKYPTLLMLGRFIDGLTAGSIPIAQAAIIDVSGKENKAKNIALISLAMNIGFVLGPILGGYFSAPRNGFHFDFSTPFALAGIIALFNILLLMLFFKETSHPRKKHKLLITKGLMIVKEALRSEKIRHISIVFLLLNTALALYFQYVTLYLVQQYHYTTTHLSYFLSFLGLLAVLANTVIIRLLLRYFSPAQLTKISGAIFALGLLAIIFEQNVSLQWYMAAPILIGDSIAYACLLTLFSDAVPEDEQGWVMGIGTSLGALAWIIAGFLIAPLGITAPLLPFLVAGLFALAGTLLAKFYW